MAVSPGNKYYEYHVDTLMHWTA